MGYGQFGGGGSVKWKVHHNRGNETRGHDRDAPPGGMFYVHLPDGQVTGPYPIDENNERQITVAWTPDTLDTVPTD